jgi:Ca2+-transporting ATPase
VQDGSTDLTEHTIMEMFGSKSSAKAYNGGGRQNGDWIPRSDEEIQEDSSDEDDKFIKGRRDIPLPGSSHNWKEYKESIESIRVWRKVTYALNATRRFRSLGKQESSTGGGTHLARFRVCAQTVRACTRFRRAVRVKPLAPKVEPQVLKQLIQYHKLEDLEKLGGVEGLASLLGTDLMYGLDVSEKQLQSRRVTYGANTYPKKVNKRFWSFVWNACKDTTLNILMVCAVVSLGTGMWTEGVKKGWYEGTSIGVAVVLVIVVTAVSDYRQDLQFQKLSEEKENIQLWVVRAGKRQMMSIFDLVVGDIVPLSVGCQVPADGVLVEGYSLRIDESTMTGESSPLKKDKTKPFLMSGCKVLDGQGTMLITGVGLNTEWGQLMATVSEDNEEQTPLQERLDGAATFIGKVGLTVAVLVFLILIIRYFAITYVNASASDKKVMRVIKELVHVFSIAVTIVVVAVPEGLPLAVTLTLAYSMRKMMADKSLVRRLAACETMGSATTICSDKTGTLTTNKMTVTKAWVGGEMWKEDDASGWSSLPLKLRKMLGESICLNSNGTVSPPKVDSEPVVTGSPTEAAVLSWGIKLGMNFKDIRHRSLILHVDSFNSEKKRAGVVYKTGGGDIELHWKGAAEILLALCSHWINSAGDKLAMSEEKREELHSVIEAMAAKTLRCIAFAYRPLDEADVPDSEESRSDWEVPDSGLTLMAIAGIKDTCRPGVREAVEKCQNAGVKVRMVTGDNIFTAKAIASECGILKEGGLVVEGQDFRRWDDEKVNKELENLVVMARSSPMDKLKLVKLLKERGEVVAVTGDGTNDAPALSAADIGLAMGIAGTEVAKESSDIIILDDDFASVVKVVCWGRSVYANIQKFIQFQLTVNVVALTINFVAAVTSGEVPLTAVQLLWVNLIMDTMGALALATEAPTDDLMDRKPVGRTEPLITNIMWRNIFGQAVYQIVVLLTLTYSGISILGLEGPRAEQDLMRNTIIFNAFVFCQLFNEVNARHPEAINVFKGIHKNSLFMGIIVITIFFQFIIVTYLNDFADTIKLPLKWWGLCIAIGSVALPLAVLVKKITVPETPILEISCFPTKPFRFNLKRPPCFRSTNRGIPDRRLSASRRFSTSTNHIDGINPAVTDPVDSANHNTITIPT